MDIFDYMREQTSEKESPLASRLRPTTLEEVVGQQHIIGRDKLLYRAIKADKLSSIIFYGLRERGKLHLPKSLQIPQVLIFSRLMQRLLEKRIWNRLWHRQKIIWECIIRRQSCL